ncbi:GntR family transcriptional regulator [Archaeoglobus profundus]|uniref:Transcriptional regulator, GntR family n=1 Tax=Archaeoglobus profundus (strain DSM 5631 / JCM 9629 / NBRC 100127 / Av18) TaxID=572546 RepID=D2RGU2_ARCPA|nr:DeoR family transcriptional regulator [Archaeoglobus profundus]ADB57517.1 transcriptional regulator, GntR family [Archaeoglobus profundus DSM 5631]
MKKIKIENVMIELEEPLRFFKFEADKIYEVEIDLQRFPIIKKFRSRNGGEYPACIYNLRILRENGKEINSEWMQRRVSVGDYREDENGIRVKPRMFSEFWQLAQIYDKFRAGIHKCIVKTKGGNKGQVLTRIIHSKDCDCLKSREGEKRREERDSDIQVYHPQEIAERLKEDIKEEKAITVKEVMDRYNTNEETARKALDVLTEEGLAVKIREDKYFISPKSEL